MRINVTEAVRRFSDLVNRVFYQGETFELERGKRVVARLGPAKPTSSVQASDLASIFQKLPRLDEDAEAFARDVESACSLARPERDAWD